MRQKKAKGLRKQLSREFGEKFNKSTWRRFKKDIANKHKV